MFMSRVALGTYCMVLTVLALSLPPVAEAQSEEEQSTLLVYQVGDLVLNVRDYPAPSHRPSDLSRGYGTIDHAASGMGFMALQFGGGDMGGGGMGGGEMGGGGMGGGGMGGGGMGGVGGGGMGGGDMAQGVSRQVTMNDLIETIMSIVEPNSWDQVGGPGAIRPLGASLLISQTPTVHEQIESLFEQLREGSGERKTVAVDARWLLLDSDELEQLMPPDEEGRPQVDRQMLATFTRRSSSIRGLTNCFSDQLIYLVSGTRRNMVESQTPVVGSLDRPAEEPQYASNTGNPRYILASQNGSRSTRSVGYMPVVGIHNFGALLEIRPTVVGDEERAVVDVRSTLTVPSEQPFDHATANLLSPPIDRIAIETHELAATFRMPLGQPFLVGGMTFKPLSGAPLDASTEESNETAQFYLILELR